MAQWDDAENPSDPTGAGPSTYDPYVNGPQAQAVSQIQQWYQQYLGRQASLDEVNAQLGNPGGLSAVEGLIKGSPEAQAYAASQAQRGPDAPSTPTTTTTPPPTSTPPPSTTTPTGLSYADVLSKLNAYASGPGGWGRNLTDAELAQVKSDLGFQDGALIDPSALTTIQQWVDTHKPSTTTTTPPPTTTQPPTTTTPPGTTGGGGGGSSSSSGGGGAPYGLQNFYTPPAQFNYPAYTPPTFTAPTFDAPAAFSYPTYALPTGQDVLAQDPGFAFREQEGSRAITNDASARGILKGTGTAKALEDYNSSLASQEYGNAAARSQGVFAMNRANAADDYNTLWKNMLTDYGVKYGAATDAYNRAADTYDRNFKTAATAQGFNIDAANGLSSGASAAGNYTLGAGNLALNSSNDTFNNLLNLYKASTANLPTYTPPTTAFA